MLEIVAIIAIKAIKFIANYKITIIIFLRKIPWVKLPVLWSLSV